MRISRVLPISVILVSLASMAVFFLISFVTLKQDIKEKSETVLANLAAANQKGTAELLAGLHTEIAYQAGSNAFVKAMVDLQSGWDASDSTAVSAIYLADVEDRSAIILADGEEMYEYMHEAHHSSILSYVKKSAFSDVFVLSPDRQIIYTALKNEEFGVSLGDGKPDNAGFSVLAETLDALGADKISQSRFFARQADGAQFAYLATPIMIEGSLGGYLVGKVSATRIARGFESFGMIGRSGAISMIDDAGTFVSGTTGANAALLPVFDGFDLANPSADLAPVVATSKSGSDVDYTFSISPIQSGNQNFWIVVQETNAEIYAALDTLVELLAIAAVTISTCVSFMVYFGAQIVSRPLTRAANMILSLAHGDANTDITISSRFREIQQIASSLSTFRDNAQQKVRLEEAAALERKAERIKQQRLESLVSNFKEDISDVLSKMGRETEAMRSSATILNEAVTTASNEGNVARQSTEDASSNVQVIAAASEEMSSSIQEISSQAHRANDCVQNAAEIVSGTSRDIALLSEASDKIGAVVELIRKISEKTKMLALNARIEASRAGEAGQSFVIVANEVRTLSEQTADATDDIESQILRVQSTTRDTVNAIKKMSDSMQDISQTTATIAEAVEEQGKTTQEITRSISLAADGSTQASRSVETVAMAIGNTDHEANRVLGVSDELAGVTSQLALSVEHFLDSVASCGETEAGLVLTGQDRADQGARSGSLAA